MRILIIDRAVMQMGGIEVSFARFMEDAIGKGYRVIWFTTPLYVKKSAFPITNHSKVEKMHVRRTPLGPLFPKISLSPEDDVIMLSTDPVRYLLSDGLRNNTHAGSFVHLLLLPHFRGAAYYPEEIFKSLALSNYWHLEMKRVATALTDAECVRGFSLRHLEAYEKAYGVSITNPERYVVPAAVRPKERLSRENLLMKAQSRKAFVEIITCARFDFPHKGYILGLIRAFPKIKKSVPQAHLTIVGYGSGLDEVEQAVGCIPEGIRQSVELTGELSSEALEHRYAAAHVCVGLAGALTRGALCSLPSVLMRHYTCNCEGYGFLSPGNCDLRDDDGYDVSDTIIEVATTSDDTYVELAMQAYDAAHESSKSADPNYLFQQRARECFAGFSGFVRLKARCLFFLVRFCQLILKRPIY